MYPNRRRNPLNKYIFIAREYRSPGKEDMAPKYALATRRSQSYQLRGESAIKSRVYRMRARARRKRGSADERNSREQLVRRHGDVLIVRAEDFIINVEKTGRPAKCVPLSPPLAAVRDAVISCLRRILIRAHYPRQRPREREESAQRNSDRSEGRSIRAEQSNAQLLRHDRYISNALQI